MKLKFEITDKERHILYRVLAVVLLLTNNEALRLYAVSSSVCHCNKLPNGEIAISSKALQKPYGDLGQTDC